MFLTQFYYCHLLNKTCLMLRKNTCLNVSTFYDKINTQCLAFNANMVYPRGERDVESHLRNREEKKKSRDRKKERSFSNAILAFIELWITIIGSKCHLLKITIPRERNVERGKDERRKKMTHDDKFRYRQKDRHKDETVLSS